jgi:hypothetical protein
MNLVVVKWEGRPISQQTMTTNGMLVGNGVQFPYHER